MDTKGMSFAERNEYWDMVLEDYDSSGLDRKLLHRQEQLEHSGIIRWC